jgi:hypothetical protein
MWVSVAIGVVEVLGKLLPLIPSNEEADNSTALFTGPVAWLGIGIRVR